MMDPFPGFTRDWDNNRHSDSVSHAEENNVPITERDISVRVLPPALIIDFSTATDQEKRRVLRRARGQRAGRRRPARPAQRTIGIARNPETREPDRHREAA